MKKKALLIYNDSDCEINLFSYLEKLFQLDIASTSMQVLSLLEHNSPYDQILIAHHPSDASPAFLDKLRQKAQHTPIIYLFSKNNYSGKKRYRMNNSTRSSMSVCNNNATAQQSFTPENTDLLGDSSGIYKQLVELIDEGIAILSQSGNCLYLNQSLQRMVGNNFIGKHVAVLFDMLWEDVIIKNLQTIETEKHAVFEALVRNCKTGMELPVLVQHRTFSTADFRGSIMIISDLTVIREKYDAHLPNRDKHTDRLDIMKNIFIDNISHELRTPVTIIKEAVSLVADNSFGQINREQQRVIQIALDNIERLTKIINQLIDISMLEGSIPDIYIEKVDLYRMISGICNRFEGKAAKQDITVRWDCKSDIPIIKTDRKKLTQIIHNLFENALKFSQAGNEILLSAQHTDTEVEIFVKDDGCGIAKQELSRIFEKFHQINRQPGTGERGTGLGLAITAKLVSILKGTISVDSELGEGTCVKVTLPIHFELMP